MASTYIEGVGEILASGKWKDLLNKAEKYHLLGNGAMVITVLFWGTSFVSIKIAVSAVPPITLALLRFLLASFILWLLLKKWEPSAKLERRDWLRMGVSGFLGVTLYFFLENSGIRLSTASNAALITSVIPILATALDAILYKTRISAVQCAGMALAMIGSYFAITANGLVQLDSAHLTGNLFILGAMVSWVLYTFCSKAFGSKYSGLMATFCQNAFGTILLVPLALTEYQEWRAFPPSILFHILFLAVFCSAGCYLLYNYALRKLDVTATTMYLNLVPIVGVLGGHAFLQETVLPIQLAGGAVIIGGILLVNGNLRKRKQMAHADNMP